MHWYVLYVNSRTEKKVAQRLSEKGIEVFCPMKMEERQWSDRVKKVEVPYFRSYVFAKFSPKEVEAVLETPGVVRRLFWLQKPAVIREEEMEEVKAFFTTHQNIEHLSLTEGEQVQIARGVLKDKKGIVLVSNKHQVTLNIPALGYGFKVTLDKSQLH